MSTKAQQALAAQREAMKRESLKQEADAVWKRLMRATNREN